MIPFLASPVSNPNCAAHRFCHRQLCSYQHQISIQAAWTKVATEQELAAAGGKKVVEVNGQKILLASYEGSVYAVSNKCSHLGLPLVGKTALFQGEISDKCITCPAHGSKFDLATGQPVGEWCPKFPSLPLVGKMGDKKPLPTFESRVDGGAIEVNV